MHKDKISIDEILENLKIGKLNEMQASTLKASRSGGDIVLLSDTGSGKTLAYLLPILPKPDKPSKKSRAVIVAPSRELVQQIESVFRQMGTGMKITACYGGHRIEIEENNLVEHPAVIVATPGRLCDHIRRGNIDTGSVETIVLDEFDKSLELGFQEEMSFIISSLPAIKRRILVSATSMQEIPEFVGISEPQVLDFLSEGKADGLDIKVLQSPVKDKLETLYKFICAVGGKSIIVFCNHREAVERTAAYLQDNGVFSEYYHGALEQQERDSALAKFRNGSANVLVTTDLAARGLDIPGVRYVVHYHLPHTQDAFVHRNGRTARMDATGTVVLILSDEEKVPEYVTDATEEIMLPEVVKPPELPKWATLFIGAGKKDKINKVDIVGFLANKGQLKTDNIGLIEVKDFFSFVAVRRTKAKDLLQLIRNEKIKNKKVRMALAK